MNRLLLRAIIATVGGIASAASAQSWAGNVVVSQVDPGGTATSGVGYTVRLRDYSASTSSATFNQSFAFNSGASGTRLVITSSATSEGFLTRSVDGQYLSIAGYNAAHGTAAVVGAAANADRVYSLVNITGPVNMNVVTAGTQATTFNTSSIRSAVALDADTAYLAGTGSTTTTAGVRFINQVGPVNNRVAAAPTNIRVVNVHNGKVYFSSASGTFVGISTFDLAQPTATDSATSSLLFGSASGTGAPSPYDFFFASDSVCYVADDRTAANGGGLQKWVNGGSGWSLAYTLNLATGGIGMRGLAGQVSGDSVDLYAISADSSLQRLLGVTDVLSAGTLPGSAVVSVLDTAAAGTVFRGVEVIPAPGTLALLGLGSLVATRRRRV